ncbi:MAG: hypothetical protein CMI08_15245 [Oceanospirillaceae bacterium]|uniref:hypothetical protein n=1 Tax=unclassified Thalassolituus TaxID=2624967 RepID=UPI000C516D6B|nr:MULTISPECIES: hypothetical protein [unclassified Thalassolituus]MAY00525.1 hypothetical protein [Oceanospirillaceae bacterium]MBL35771.1 hypothetical protein [Oceanospirillaceae bacterium]MBS52943.1 hypothetical protein [Oceanospirillaceae bacterium]MBS53854.1 hypothetical protein [Oceanospirillaceae bacterium]|tara:strand:+ start:4559 stop:5569 length:1011 start_codon:yes stop_codon:yes gene_type:complete
MRGFLGDTVAGMLGSRLGAGGASAIAILFVIFAFVGAYEYATQLIFDEPIFALTNPCMMLIYYQIAWFISRSENSNYFMHATGVLLVPVQAALTMWLVLAMIPDSILEYRHVSSFMKIYHKLHELAFGDLYKQFEYFPRMRWLALHSNSYWAIMWIIGFASAIWVVFNLFMHKESMINLVSMHTKKPKYETLDVYLALPIMWLITGFIMVLFYPAMYTMADSSLPDYVTIPLMWLILLSPMYGVLLPSVNWNRPKDQRLATFIPKFYFAALTLYLAFCAWETIPYFQDPYNVKTIFADFYLLYSTVALIPFWLFLLAYLIRNPKPKAEEMGKPRMA